jgi:hypothetical protein
MERMLFEERLVSATQHALQFAREHVLQHLPDEFAFRVYPNQSCDSAPRVGDEIVFPEESLAEDQYHGPWLMEHTVKYLWRDGRIPEWIDIAVEAEEGQRTLVGLLCCGRFTATEDLQYHHRGGLAPFAIKSPILPPFWESVEKSGKFDLYFRRPKRKSKWWFW